MDVMELRRRMLQMAVANGLDYISGTVTITSDYVLNFGKTFEKYIAIFEMTDESKTTLINTGQTGNRTWSIISLYPPQQINSNNTQYTNIYECINPSTGVQGIRYDNAAIRTNSSIMFSRSYLDNSPSANALYIGLTYKYTVISLDGIF